MRKKNFSNLMRVLTALVFIVVGTGIAMAGNFTGNSSNCKDCHLSQYALWANSTHTSKLITRDDAMARGYPNPPGGYSWDNVSLVIGNKWKIRYVNDTGYIITKGGLNQFNIDDQIWTDYNKDTVKKYNCGHCHATGYLSNVTDIVKEPFRTLRSQGQLQDGIYDNSLTPGFVGYWAENSIGCEACHGNGGDHVLSPSKLNIRNASVLRDSPAICGDCHSRPNTGEYEFFKPYPDGVNDTLLVDTLYDASPMPTVDISKIGGHHEQWEDWKASGHSTNSIGCATCHGGHNISNSVYANGPTGKTKFINGSVYPAVVNKSCTDCHESELPKHGYYSDNSECISCHMPLNRKSSNKVDLRSHWFDINGLRDNKNGDVHKENFNALSAVTESCTNCHNSSTVFKPIFMSDVGMHKDVDKSEGLGKVNSSDCKACHYTSTQNRQCETCHIDQVVPSPKVAEHISRSSDVKVSENCSLCHNNSINRFKYSANASVDHYGTKNSLIDTSNCIDCHNGIYTDNASWGSPVNISTSAKRQHMETQTSQCDSCHKDSNIQTLAAVTFHNASVKSGLPPPVSQNLGLYDTQFKNISTTTCRGCHSAAPDIHHAMRAKGTTNLGCLDCHPMEGTYPNQQMYVEKECKNCHSDSAAYAKNPAVDLRQIRPPGRPHHNTTKNSSLSMFQAAYWAIDRQCNNCHGSSLVANYDDGHIPSGIPTYNTSLVTPFADFKINATIGNGREWGGCAACHNKDGAIINSNSETHHGETVGMLGRQCNYCHVAQGSIEEPNPDRSSDPSASPLRIWLNASYPNYVSMFGWDTSIMHVELRNATIFNSGDAINGTGCQKCHTVANLHNIQYDAANTIPNEIPGYGHVGNNSDCNGCHAGWSASTDNPFAAETSIALNSVAPGKLTAGTDTDVTLIGNNFVQEGYATTVLLDGVSLTPKSLTETQIVVTIPATTSVGVHGVQVQKGSIRSSLTTLTVASPVTITSARLESGVITITGTGFGVEAEEMVTITSADGRIFPSDSITSWSDTQIVATSSIATVGDSVTVTMANGSGSAIIESGVVAPSVTVTSPNGGENWKRGTTQTITWVTTGIYGDNVNIYTVFTNSKGKTTTTAIATGVPNSGSYSWNIPRTQTTGTTYKIKIATNLEYMDTSDNNFQISR